MKIFRYLLNFLIAVIFCACSTTPKFDKNFGQSINQAIEAQKFSPGERSMPAIRAAEFDPAYQNYVKSPESRKVLRSAVSPGLVQESE